MRYEVWISVTISVGLAFSLANQAHAQSQSLAATIGVAVFPADGQDTTQQSKDEAASYSWAVDNTGVAPFDLQKKQEAQDQQKQ